MRATGCLGVDELLGKKKNIVKATHVRSLEKEKKKVESRS